MKRFSLFLPLPLLALFAFAFFVSAQDDEKKGESAEEKKEEVAKEEGADKDLVKVKLGIDAANPMKYDKEKLEVPAGKKIQLTFENTGNLPKIGGGHNIVILKKGVEVVPFAIATGTPTMQVAMGQQKVYLTDDQKKQVIAFSKVLGPKDKDVIEFTAPKEAGEYDFVCTYPAHFAMMKGKLVVK